MNLNQVYQYTVEGSPSKVKDLTEQALAEGVPPDTIINEYLIPAMAEVGDRFERNEYYVPELLVAALAMQGALAILRPLLTGKELSSQGRIVVGTVRGDLHDIGKNLVSMMLEGSGFEVIDLGTNVAPERFVSVVKETKPQVIAMSALLSTTMQEMRTTIAALEEAGIRDRVKVLVGGAPVTQTFADLIGADGFAPDANSAVRKAKELLRAP